MRFDVTVMDPVSRLSQRMSVDAESADLARTADALRGWVVVRVQGGTASATPQLPPGAVVVLCKELLALLGAGLSVVEALESLGASSGGGGIHQALMTELSQGRSLSQAMANVSGFPPLLVASVKASERTSDLPHALEAYLRFDDLVSTLRRRVISAALYPAFVVALGGLVALFLLTVVVPRFARLYGDVEVKVSWMTSTLLQLSAWLARHPAGVPLIAVSLIAAAVWAWRAGWWRDAARWLVWRLPFLTVQADHFDRARLFEGLALLVRGGYSLHEALGMVDDLASSGRSKARVSRVRVAVAQGVAVSAAFEAGGLTDAVTVRLIRAGERGGQFERVLAAVAERHRQSFETFVERATRLVEPLLLLGVALLIGSMVVVLYMPIFDIASSVQ